MTTNYRNVFIGVAPDCPAASGEKPPTKSDKPTIAELQYRIIADAPYTLTSDDVLYAVHVERSGLAQTCPTTDRAVFFAADRACLRASPLGKRYGWGIHHDENERVALVAVGTAEYDALRSDPGITQKSAMRSRR